MYGPALFATLAILAVGSASEAAGRSDPASVLQVFAAAVQANDVDAALALWAEDGVLVDESGETIKGREALRAYIRANPSWMRRADLGSIEASGFTVRWSQPIASDPYRKLKVAPVLTRAALHTRGGMIEALILHFPSEELARIEKACGVTVAKPVMIGTRTCREHVERARAHGSGAERLIAPR